MTSRTAMWPSESLIVRMGANTNTPPTTRIFRQSGRSRIASRYRGMSQPDKYRHLAQELRAQADQSRTMRDAILVVARHFEACAAAIEAIAANNARGAKRLRLAA